METNGTADGGSRNWTRRLAVFGFCVGVSVGVAEFVTKAQQQLYRATATIQILPAALMRAWDPALVPAIVTDDKYLATQLVILAQPETVLAAVTSGKLKDDPEFQGRSPVQIAAMAAGRIECARRRGTGLIDVSVTGTEPKTLDKLANALVERFKQMQRTETRQLRNERKAHLDDKITAADCGKHLATADKINALQQAQFDEATFDLDFAALRARFEKLLKAVDDLSDDLAARELAVSEARRAREAVAGDESAEHVLAIERDARVEALSRRIVSLTQDRERFLVDGITRQHPRVADVDAQIALAVQERKELVQQAADRLIRKHEADVVARERSRQAQESTRRSLVAAAAVKAKVDACNEVIREFAETRRAAQRELDQLMQRSSDEKDAVIVVARAKEPDAPLSPKPGRNLTIGLAVGLVAGLLWTALRK